jgi:hypothetical protein
MTKVPDFVAGLARSTKSAADIKKTINSAYGDKARTIYNVNMRTKAGETTDNQCFLSDKEKQKDS